MKQYTKKLAFLLVLVLLAVSADGAYRYRDLWLPYLLPAERVGEKYEQVPPEIKPGEEIIPEEEAAPEEEVQPEEEVPPGPRGTILFLGDSITYRWDTPEDIGGCSTINAGIDGNTTANMLLRFQEDVVERKPDRVFILGGINDILIAYQYDLVTLDLHLEKSSENIRLMTRMAEKAGIEPVLCSVLPVAPDFVYSPEEINATVKRMNSSIKKIASQEKVDYLDLWPYLLDPDTKMLQNGYATEDGIHLSTRGYFELLKAYTTYMNKHPVERPD